WGWGTASVLQTPYSWTDANTTCEALPPLNLSGSGWSWVGNLRAESGPTGGGRCMYDAKCVSSACRLGDGSYPTNAFYYGKWTWFGTLACADAYVYAGKCQTVVAKAKGAG